MRSWVRCWIKGVEVRYGKMVNGLGGQNGWLYDLMGMLHGHVDALFVAKVGG